MPPPPIPDRWLDYKGIGNQIEGTRFIAFKVPLRREINQAFDKEQRLDRRILLERVPNLGLIIDLTNTDRYYDPRSFKASGVEHKKVYVPGHVTPPPELVNTFKKYVSDFLERNSDNDKLIGVHCTHGVNRTGFLICNYLITEMAMDPDDAIKRFNKGRGHDIERGNYLNALKELRGLRNKRSLSLPKSPSSSVTLLRNRKRSNDTSYEMVNDYKRKRLYRDQYNRNDHNSFMSPLSHGNHYRQNHSDEHNDYRNRYVSDRASNDRSYITINQSRPYPSTSTFTSTSAFTSTSTSTSTSTFTSTSTSISTSTKWDGLHTFKRNYGDHEKRHFDGNKRYHNNHSHNNKYNNKYNNKDNDNDYQRSSNTYNNRNYHDNYRKIFNNTNYNFRRNNTEQKYVNPFNTSTEVNINHDDNKNDKWYEFKKPYNNYRTSTSDNSEPDRKYRKYH